MCRGFNTTFVTVLFITGRHTPTCCWFQYNFCYCSICCNFHKFTSIKCFNTTFVTVLFHSILENICRFNSFNTTFVTVLYDNEQSLEAMLQFQYNFCYCSIAVIGSYKLYFVPVSIQLLLLFYRDFFCYIFLVNIVSIQLLLLFYLHDIPINPVIKKVSIQLLLLFYYIM